MPLSKTLDATPFTGLAITFVHTGYNVSIEFVAGVWSPHEFAASPSEAILKCIRLHAPTTAAIHDSSCSINNAPALPVGPCDCSLSPPLALAAPPY